MGLRDKYAQAVQIAKKSRQDFPRTGAHNPDSGGAEIRRDAPSGAGRDQLARSVARRFSAAWRAAFS